MQIVDVSESQEEICKKSKLIVTGVPTKDYKLPTEWVSPGAFVWVWVCVSYCILCILLSRLALRGGGVPRCLYCILWYYIIYNPL